MIQLVVGLILYAERIKISSTMIFYVIFDVKKALLKWKDESCFYISNICLDQLSSCTNGGSINQLILLQVYSKPALIDI